MFVQILPTSTIRNIWRTLRRTCILILGLKRLTWSGFFRHPLDTMLIQNRRRTTMRSDLSAINKSIWKAGLLIWKRHRWNVVIHSLPLTNDLLTTSARQTNYRQSDKFYHQKINRHFTNKREIEKHHHFLQFSQPMTSRLKWQTTNNIVTSSNNQVNNQRLITSTDDSEFTCIVAALTHADLEEKIFNVSRRRRVK